MNNVIITAPSLNPKENVSGVSSVVQFIIENNKEVEYVHFELGKKDKEKRGIGNITRVWRCYKKWKKWLGNTDTESTLIHYSFPLSTPSILRDPFFMRYALSRGMKMMVHLHGGYFLTAKTTPFPIRWILRRVFAWNVPFVVLSESEKEILQERYGVKKVFVLPNCVNIPPLSEKIETSDINNRPIRLGYLGRIEPNKGMTELLSACRRLRDEGLPFELYFAGQEKREGEYLPAFEDALGESFHYVGLVSGKAKDDFFRHLDVFIMPTYFEGLPMSLLESMSYGVMPLVTPVGSIPRVIREYEINSGTDTVDFDKTSCGGIDANGIFLREKDVDSIVESVSFLSNHRRLVCQLGKNARVTICNQFSPVAYVSELNSLYQSLI